MSTSGGSFRADETGKKKRKAWGEGGRGLETLSKNLYGGPVPTMV